MYTSHSMLLYARPGKVRTTSHPASGSRMLIGRRGAGGCLVRNLSLITAATSPLWNETEYVAVPSSAAYLVKTSPSGQWCT
jgi:hypothetical protein